MTRHIKKLMLASDIIIKYGCGISHTKCKLCMQQFETINLNIFKASTDVVVNLFLNNCNKKTNEKIKHYHTPKRYKKELHMVFYIYPIDVFRCVILGIAHVHDKAK